MHKESPVCTYITCDGCLDMQLLHAQFLDMSYHIFNLIILVLFALTTPHSISFVAHAFRALLLVYFLLLHLVIY